MTRVECVNKVIQQSGDRQDKSEESKLRVKSSVAVKRFEDTKKHDRPRYGNICRPKRFGCGENIHEYAYDHTNENDKKRFFSQEIMVGVSSELQRWVTHSQLNIVEVEFAAFGCIFGMTAAERTMRQFFIQVYFTFFTVFHNSRSTETDPLFLFFGVEVCIDSDMGA